MPTGRCGEAETAPVPRSMTRSVLTAAGLLAPVVAFTATPALAQEMPIDFS